MTLVIDYGRSSAKTLLIFDSDKPPFIFEVPLGFSAYTRNTVPESVLFVIREVAKASGVELLEGATVKVSTFVMGEIASTKLKGILASDPADPAEVLKKSPLPLINVGCGFGFVLGKVFRGSPESEAVSRWLPFKIGLPEVENFLANEKLFEQVLPATPRDLTLKQAIARETIRKARGAKVALPEEVLVTGAVFSKAPRFEQVALIILDSLEPQGILKIKVDKSYVVRSLAFLRIVSERTYDKVLSLLPKPVSLGTTLSLGGGGDLEVDLGAGEPQALKVKDDSLVLLPVEEGESVRITIAGQDKKDQILEVEGGEVGVIVDCRRRPIVLPPRAKERFKLLKQWDKEANAHGQVGEI